MPGKHSSYGKPKRKAASSYGQKKKAKVITKIKPSPKRKSKRRGK